MEFITTTDGHSESLVTSEAADDLCRELDAYSRHWEDTNEYAPIIKDEHPIHRAMVRLEKSIMPDRKDHRITKVWRHLLRNSRKGQFPIIWCDLLSWMIGIRYSTHLAPDKFDSLESYDELIEREHDNESKLHMAETLDDIRSFLKTLVGQAERTEGWAFERDN